MTEREDDTVEFIRFLDSLGIVKEYFALLRGGNGAIPMEKRNFVAAAFDWESSDLAYWSSVDEFWGKGLSHG